MIKETIILTLIFIVISVIGRRLFGSVRDFNTKYKIPLRIHHGYVGLLLILIYFFVKIEWLWIIGISLFLADMIYHFVVLRIWIGETEFP
jgi:hypothetical protein